MTTKYNALERMFIKVGESFPMAKSERRHARLPPEELFKKRGIKATRLFIEASTLFFLGSYYVSKNLTNDLSPYLPAPVEFTLQELPSLNNYASKYTE